MAPASDIKTAPTKGRLSEQDEKGLRLAIEQAEKSLAERGIPIGAALISNTTGEVLGVGHNERVQKDSPTLHGETALLTNIGRMKASKYKDCTIYTTLSPCTMCTGSILLYGIPRVVIGENDTFVGGEDWLANKGVEIVNADSQKCKDLMADFIANYPEVWNEDIGEED